MDKASKFYCDITRKFLLEHIYYAWKIGIYNESKFPFKASNFLKGNYTVNINQRSYKCSLKYVNRSHDNEYLIRMFADCYETERENRFLLYHHTTIF